MVCGKERIFPICRRARIHHDQADRHSKGNGTLLFILLSFLFTSQFLSFCLSHSPQPFFVNISLCLSLSRHPFVFAFVYRIASAFCLSHLSSALYLSQLLSLLYISPTNTLLISHLLNFLPISPLRRLCISQLLSPFPISPLVSLCLFHLTSVFNLSDPLSLFSTSTVFSILSFLRLDV